MLYLPQAINVKDLEKFVNTHESPSVLLSHHRIA